MAPEALKRGKKAPVNSKRLAGVFVVISSEHEIIMQTGGRE
jgi:hypothetical protein